MACSRAHVDSRLVRQGQKNDPVGRTAYQDALRQLTEDYDDLLELDNHESATPEGLAAWERRSRSAGRPADLIVVDFLQQVRGVGKFKDKTEEVDSVAYSIKAMANEFGIPFIVLSQLNTRDPHKGNHQAQKAQKYAPGTTRIAARSRHRTALHGRFQKLFLDRGMRRSSHDLP
jgi:replicative DNA helicase